MCRRLRGSFCGEIASRQAATYVEEEDDDPKLSILSRSWLEICRERTKVRVIEERDLFRSPAKKREIFACIYVSCI